MKSARCLIGLILCTLACHAAAPNAADSAVGEGPASKALAATLGDTTRLLEILQRMPKGGDLHNHLAGAIRAERMIDWAVEEHLCFSVITLSLGPPPCAQIPVKFPTTRLESDSLLRNRLIDAWSMRNWKPGTESGHDHFFKTFDKYLPALGPRMGEMLAEVTASAAKDHLEYLELMITPDEGSIIPLGAGQKWNPSVSAMRSALESAGLKDSLKRTSAALDTAEVRRRELQHCDTPAPDAGCKVTVRYLYQVLRGLPRQIVFTQILAGFEWASAEPRVVGLNLVMPEDDSVPMHDFDLHMAILDSLHGAFPKVPVTLHAGELTTSLVKGDLGNHIRKSIEVAHARRIGHGVDIMSEERPEQLLKAMADSQVLVEVSLTSNRFILGVQGAAHPLAQYLSNGVPVALTTDDAGVSRSDMTHEWLAAIVDQHLDYHTLKKMARNSIEFSFVEGKSLWQDHKAFNPVSECSAGSGGLKGATCSAYVTLNLKARLEWELETAFANFEASFAFV